MAPQDAMRERYPDADFSAYFAFIESHRGTKKGRDTQEHHIAPQSRFPEYVKDPANLIYLRTDAHAEAHRLLKTAEPDFKHTAPTAWLAAASRGGRVGIQTVIALRRGIHAPNYDRSKNVRNGGIAAAKLKAGAHAPGFADKGRHVRWHATRGVVSRTCVLCRLMP